MVKDTADTTIPAITAKEFFEGCAPGPYHVLSDLGRDLDNRYQDVRVKLNFPDILLYCDKEECEGERFFHCLTDLTTIPVGTFRDLFVVYRCRNCNARSKTFAVSVCPERDFSGFAMKYGEVPAFGPPTPSRLIGLIGPDRELFLKGRRSENQGLGIAAFAYYRRVVENQKNRIFDEVMKVCRRLSADDAIVAELTAAKNETQFTKAIQALKHGIPQVLYVNGENPLTLLHGALSEGLHAETDEDCLQIATAIRVVMAALAERMGQALKDEAELSTAVTQLLKKRSAPKQAQLPASTGGKQ